MSNISAALDRRVRKSAGNRCGYCLSPQQYVMGKLEIEHFQWSRDGIQVQGLTSIGRATVVALRLNNEIAVEVRRNWVRAGWHPPQER